MSSLSLPSGYSRIQVVRSFAELATTRLDHGINALCWPRELPEGFGEVVERLGCGMGLVHPEATRVTAPVQPVGFTPLGEEGFMATLVHDGLLSSPCS